LCSDFVLLIREEVFEEKINNNTKNSLQLGMYFLKIIEK